MPHRTLILTGYGLNCEKETQYACEVSGGQIVQQVHFSQLLTHQISLKDYHFILFIGGFLDGDDLGAGKFGANRLKYSSLAEGQKITLYDQLLELIAQGRLVLGICNGFQVIIKLGLLPTPQAEQPSVSLTTNRKGRFEDRWVHLVADSSSPCIFTQGIQHIELPIRHGEGRIEADQETVLQPLLTNHQVPLQYSNKEGRATERYPENPNGSPWGIASLCNEQGNVMGLMPHPEAFNHYTNHPQWTRKPYQGEDGDGLQLFKNAYQYLEQGFTA